MAVDWNSVPEEYRPSPEKPWRVIWGFGAFEDFATKAEAQACAERLRKDWAGQDWADSVKDPFDTGASAWM